MIYRNDAMTQQRRTTTMKNDDKITKAQLIADAVSLIAICALAIGFLIVT